MASVILGDSAVQLFNEGNYDNSLEALEKIRHQKDDDPKVEHNIAIAQYFQGGCRQPKQILETLAKIKSRIEESQHSNDNDAPYAEENDTSLLSFNEAVMYFQLKQHATSTAILEELFSNIEPIEEGLAVKICFLLLDNYWVLRRTSKAAPAIAFLERIVDQAGGETWTPSADKPCACPESIDIKKFELRLHMHKAQYHLLNQSFRSSKKEIKQALNVSTHSAEAMLLKANFEFLRRNYRKSLKLLHSVSKSQAEHEAQNKPADGSKHKVSPITPAIHNNAACIHFSLNNYNAALWYLSRALKATDMLAHQSAQGSGEAKPGTVPIHMFAHCHKSEMLYNSGLQQLLTGRPAEAFVCFQEASVVLFHLPRLWLRLAECCIAEHCLLKQRQSSRSHDPLITASIDSGKAEKLVLPITPVCGMPPRVSAADEDGNATAANASLGAPVEVALTIEYAMHCARNSLYLARPQTRAPAESSPPDTQGNGSSPAAAPNSADLAEASPEQTAEHVSELHAVRVHSLVALAYCGLCSLSPEVALAYAQQLIAETDGCGSEFGEMRLLGHLYAAEALVVMNRVVDAMAFVQPSVLGDHLLAPAAPAAAAAPTAKDRGSDDEAEADRGPHPSHHYSCEAKKFDHPQMRCQMYVNMATVMATNGEFDKAERFAQKALIAKPADQSALLLHIYLQLQRGDKDGALSTLKDSRNAAHTE